MLVAPSPKSQDQDVGVPVEVSVNCTACPAFGEDGDHVKFAPGVSGSVERFFVRNVDPAAFEATRLTVNEDCVVYVCEGFCAVLVAPSPKSHDQDVGSPVEVSVNCTACPAFGDDGDQVKFAPGVSGSVEIPLTLR